MASNASPILRRPAFWTADRTIRCGRCVTLALACLVPTARTARRAGIDEYCGCWDWVSAAFC